MKMLTFQEKYAAIDRSIFGTPPTHASEKSVLNIVRFTTPISPLIACASNAGICLLDFEKANTL